MFVRVDPISVGVHDHGVIGVLAQNGVNACVGVNARVGDVSQTWTWTELSWLLPSPKDGFQPVHQSVRRIW